VSAGGVAMVAACAVLGLAAAAPATACESTAACLQVIAAAQAQTRTVIARFTQTKHVSLLDQPLVSTGRFLFKRPDHIRLEIESPRIATITITGRDISIPGMTEADKQQLGMTPMAAMFSALGAMFSGDTDALQRHFAVVAEPADGGIAVTLTPTVADWQRLFRRIALRFRAPDYVLTAMELDDALGDHLDIAMTEIERNRDLPDQLFAATPAP
jgi:outer membrane lipoprotein-sorting protein